MCVGVCLQDRVGKNRQTCKPGMSGKSGDTGKQTDRYVAGQAGRQAGQAGRQAGRQAGKQDVCQSSM